MPESLLLPIACPPDQNKKCKTITEGQSEATESAFERQLSAGYGPIDEKKRYVRLAHFRECANLGFQSLVVLALDLQFRLELLHEQVQMSDLDAKLLDVRRSWRWANRGGRRL